MFRCWILPQGRRGRLGRVEEFIGRHRRLFHARPGDQDIENTLLLWAALLAFVQMLVAVTGATLQVGLPLLAGNREGLPPCTGWV